MRVYFRNDDARYEVMTYRLCRAALPENTITATIIIRVGAAPMRPTFPSIVCLVADVKLFRAMRI